MMGKPSKASLAFLWDHCVAGRPLLPAAAMIEMACAATSASFGNTQMAAALTRVSIPSPLLLPLPDTRMLTLVLALDTACGLVSLESESPQTRSVPHMRSTVALAARRGDFLMEKAPLQRSSLAGLTVARQSPQSRQPCALGYITCRKVLQAEGFLIDPAAFDNGTQVI